MQVAERVEQTLPVVRRLALRLSRRLPPSIDYDDLVQEGTLGLMQAAARFNPEAHDNFKLYAQRRILGAMLDSVRRRHWISATSVPLEEAKGLEGEEDFESEIEEQEIVGLVRKARRTMTGRRQKVVELVYRRGLSRNQAAREMRMSPDQFGALHAQTLDLLRYKLRSLRPAA